MTPRSLTPGELEQSYARAATLRSDVERKQRAFGRKVSALAKGVADLMEPGGSHHRCSVGIHAFAGAGSTWLAASYLEDEGNGYRYRFAVLCGGEAARRALRMADLDPGDSDQPGPERRVFLATYGEYEDFVERLPAYLADVSRDWERLEGQIDTLETKLRESRRRVSTLKRRRLSAARSARSGPRDVASGGAVARETEGS
jgi:hypothetical protein